MSLFKQRKNKRFSYKSQFHNETESNRDELESQWKILKRDKPKRSSLRSLPILLILLVMALILMYILQIYE